MRFTRLTLGSPIIDGKYSFGSKKCVFILVFSVYNFIDYARSSSMRGQLVMHQCLHYVHIFS